MASIVSEILSVSKIVLYTPPPQKRHHFLSKCIIEIFPIKVAYTYTSYLPYCLV